MDGLGLSFQVIRHDSKTMLRNNRAKDPDLPDPVWSRAGHPPDNVVCQHRRSVVVSGSSGRGVKPLPTGAAALKSGVLALKRRLDNPINGSIIMETTGKNLHEHQVKKGNSGKIVRDRWHKLQ